MPEKCDVLIARRSLVLGAAYGLVVGLAGCPAPEFDVRAEPGPTPAQPSFAIGRVENGCSPLGPGEYAELRFLRVDPCGVASVPVDSAFWVLESTGLGAAPRRVAYGVAPVGFQSRVGPRPLTPGCYRVSAAGKGSRASAEFTIAANATTAWR